MTIFKPLLILIGVLCCYGHCFAQEIANVPGGKVTSVENGNTLIVSTEKQKLRVRLIGVDVPLQALGKQSREHLAAIVKGKVVALLLTPAEVQEGNNKLVVGKVTAGNLDVGLEQIRSGLAWQSREFGKYQTDEELRIYSDSEKSAIKDKRGLWGAAFLTCQNAPVKTTIGNGAKPPKNPNHPDVYGTVVVETTIDKSGKVASARAICGHPALQAVAVRAALRSKHKPQPSKSTGRMLYNFSE